MNYYQYLRHVDEGDVESRERPTREEIEPDRHPLPPTLGQAQMIREAFADPEMRKRHGW